MMSINIAVIDDEVKILEMICNLIRIELAQDDTVKIMAFSSGEEFLQQIERKERFDILLCDIEMNGIDGITLGKIVKQRQYGIYLIYLTSYSEFAVESYKVNAYQYVLKLEMEKRLPRILYPLIEKIKASGKNYKLMETSNTKEKVYYSDIIYMYKEKGTKYVKYITTEKNFRERITLEKALEQLQSKDFILVERGYVVNMKHITKIEKNTIYLTNSDQVIISRLHIRKVKEQINLQWS